MSYPTNRPLSATETKAPQPTTVQDYLEIARLWRPAGIVAFHIPLLTGAYISMIINETPASNFLNINAQLLLASMLQRAAACVWNDACDWKFDAQVTRTKDRPIPRGSISANAARIWAIVLTIGWLQSVHLTSPWAMWTVVPNLAFHIAYPYMKRVTYWPSVFLGFTFSLNVCTGYVMLAGHHWRALVGQVTIMKLLGTAMLSQITYAVLCDTIYAYQDYEDDIQAGVRSVALRLGNGLRGTVGIALMSAAHIILLIWTGQQIHAGSSYYILVCGGSCLLTFAAVLLCDLKDANMCGLWFKRILLYGLIVQCGGLIPEYLQKNWI